MMPSKSLYDVAMIVLNYNSCILTVNAVNHLLSFNSELQVIIVDNSSTDNSKKILTSEYIGISNVHLIFNDNNLGYAHGNNIGIEYARNLENIKYIGIMNPDVLADISVIEELVKVLNIHNDIGLITTAVYYNGKYFIPNQCAWRIPQIIDMLTLGTFIGYISVHFLSRFGYKSNTQGYYFPEYYSNKKLVFVDVVQGCFFMGKLDTFLVIDKLDEHTFLYYEENILAAKIRKLGKNNAVLTKHYIQHNHHEKDKSLQKRDSKIFDMTCMHNSRDYFIREYTDYNQFFKFLLRRFLNMDFYIRKMVVKILYKN